MTTQAEYLQFLIETSGVDPNYVLSRIESEITRLENEDEWQKARDLETIEAELILLREC